MDARDHAQGATQTISVTDFASWRSLVSEAFVPLNVTSNATENFHAKLRSRSLGDVFVSEVGANPHSVERTPALIAAGDTPFYKLSLQLAGTGILMQDGREAILSAGDMAIYDTGRPYTLSFAADFRTLVLMFPQSVIDLPRDAVAQITAHRIAGDQGIARVVSPFLAHLTENLERLTSHSAVRLAHNTVDLVTTMLNSELDVHVDGHNASHRAALVHDIRAYIDDHLSDSHLSPASIASANFISTRHLHGVFKDQGVTVSAWIRSRRLEHCRRDLADALFADRPVSVIAARWGFTDASHFSRLFRSTFGEPPTEFRERSLGVDNGLSLPNRDLVKKYN
jgi:AraC-like DNA-binding protein